jgi:hypothetical protein
MIERRHRLLSALALLLGVLLVPASGFATEQTGKVRGTIVDESGALLEGVAITMSSENLQGTKSATTSAKGTYWVPGLPPGTYRLRAEKEGFTPFVREGIRVTIGSVLQVDVTLPIATVDEGITVTVVSDDKPILDVASSTTGQIVTKEYLDALPTNRSYQSATQLAPGVTGGANPNVKGGSSRENKWLLDGANTTDPVTGTFSFNFNIDAIDEIEVITGNFRAENGGSLGSIINVRTRSGGNRFTLNANAFYNNGNWSPKRDAVFTADGRQIESSEFDRDNQDLNINLAVGGPIVKDRLWFFGSLKYINNVSTAGGARTPRVFNGFNFFAKLTANPHPAHRMMLSVLGGPASIGNTGQSFYQAPDAQRHQYQSSLVVTFEEEWTITNFLVARVQYNHMKTAIDVTPQPCTHQADLRFKQCEDDQEEGYIDFTTPGRIGSGGAFWTDNYYLYSLNDRWRDSVRATVTGFIPNALGSHEIKGGAEFSFVRAENTFGYTGNIYYVDRLEDGGDPESTVPYYWRETGGQLFSRHTGSTIFAFIQDSWQPLPGLTIDVGVKYDRATMRNDEGERIVGFDSFTPVGGISWDPTKKKRAKLYIGGGVIIDESRLGISSFLDKNGLGRKLYLSPEFFDRADINNSYDLYSWSRGQSNYESLNNLTVPRTYSMNAGFEMLLGKATKVGIEGTAKWFRHLWEDDEVNYIWNGRGTNTLGVVNGVQSNFFRLRTPNQGARNYYSLTLQLQRRMFKNLLLDLHYTLSMTRGLTATQITAALDNPTQEEFEYGWLYSDRPHVFKGSVAYKLPFGLQLGGTVRIFSGSRFDRRYYNDKGGYDNFVASRGTFDSVNPWWDLNLKIMYAVRLPRGRLNITAELYNVTNNRAATGISQGALDSRGEYYASGRQGPMELQLGLGYDF